MSLEGSVANLNSTRQRNHTDVNRHISTGHSLSGRPYKRPYCTDTEYEHDIPQPPKKQRARTIEEHRQRDLYRCKQYITAIEASQRESHIALSQISSVSLYNAITQIYALSVGLFGASSKRRKNRSGYLATLGRRLSRRIARHIPIS
jgi:hypothetical protein